MICRRWYLMTGTTLLLYNVPSDIHGRHVWCSFGPHSADYCISLNNDVLDKLK